MSSGFTLRSRALAFVALGLLASGLGAASFDLDSLPDPTAPLNLVEADPGAERLDSRRRVDRILSGFKLGTVLIRSSDRIAVINDQRVRVGDSIGAATVVGIEKNSVTLNIDGETRELRFYSDSVKSLASGETK